MAGEEEKTTQQAQVDPFALLTQLLSGGGATVTSNSVYLGKEKKSVLPPAVIAKPGAKPQIVSLPRIISTTEADKLYINDPKLQASWRRVMQKNGLEVGNPVAERKAWQVAVTGASDWYTTSGGKAEITPEQYLTWWAGGQKKKGPALPTRQIYQVPEEQIMSDIDTVAQKVLGRTISDVDKAEEWYTDLVKGINKMYQKGTVTTVKEVVNPKTGKKEKQVVQTPGFSKEGIQERIETTVRGAAPVDVERKERVDFTKWLFSQGGQG